MRFFEDFEEGDMLQSRGRTITETDIVNFCGLSGDFIPFHSNEEVARSSMFGARIAHGALIFSISTGLWTQLESLHDTVMAFYGVDRMRFTRPVHIGDTIQLTKKLLQKEERGPDRGLVTFETVVVNQKGETVLFYVDKLVVRRRP
jgi:3-hydroxybutyryl-CoA dehydratase